MKIEKDNPYETSTAKSILGGASLYRVAPIDECISNLNRAKRIYELLINQAVLDEEVKEHRNAKKAARAQVLKYEAQLRKLVLEAYGE